MTVGRFLQLLHTLRKTRVAEIAKRRRLEVFLLARQGGFKSRLGIAPLFGGSDDRVDLAAQAPLGAAGRLVNEVTVRAPEDENIHIGPSDHVPWLDDRKYCSHVDQVQSLPISVIAACHAPAIEGARVQQAFDLWEAQNELSGKLDRIPVHSIAAE